MGEQIASVSFDLYQPLWARLLLLFGVPLHVKVEVIAEGEKRVCSVTVLPKGSKPKPMLVSS